MKTLNYLKKLTAILLLMVAFSSCSDDDNNTTPKALNIVETAQSVNDLSILVDAVIQAGLVDALTASGDKTVLAPTNAAFIAFLDANDDYDALSDIPNDVLTQILLNHVIDGASIPSSALLGNTGYTSTLADGPNETKLSIYYDGTSNTGVTFNGGATTEAGLIDVFTSNGIVHVIDEVIALPTIATFATSNTALSILVDALVYADTGTPTVPYIATVSDPNVGPYTVFAPTNTAFANLLVDLEVGALTDITAGTVNGVLLKHIVEGNVLSTQLQSGIVTTLGGEITAAVPAFTLTDGSGTSNIVTSLIDIQGVNGVVHVIDRVLR